MPLDHRELLSRRQADQRFSYSDTDVLLYNLGIGMGRDPMDEAELPYVYEQPALRAVPTLAAVIGGGSSSGGVLADSGVDWNKVLHGEQRLTLHRPLPPSAQAVADSWIAEVTDKGEGRGATITVRRDVRLESGEALFSTDNVIFARADGGFGGPPKSAFSPHKLPERAPDLVEVAGTRPDQALLYRLSGDRHPLHAQPDYARRAGFPRPILHGMCSYGIACRAVLKAVCGYDPARIRQFDVRFTAPVFPGETIHTDIWVDGGTVSFRSRVPERDVVSLNNGRCVLTG